MERPVQRGWVPVARGVVAVAIRATNPPEHGQKLQLTDCPLCGYAFDESEYRWLHFLQDHRPEDAGLSPLGTIPDCHDAPLAVTSLEDGLPDPDVGAEEVVAP